MPIRVFVFLVLCTLLSLFPARSQDLSRVPRADQPEATKLFKEYRENPDPAAREKAAQSLVRMHYTVLQAFVPLVERDWQTAITAYRSALQRQAQEVVRKRLADPAFKKSVDNERNTLLKLRRMGGGLTKDLLHNQGEPALNQLRQLFSISFDDLSASLPALARMRDTAHALTRIRALLKSKILLKNDAAYTEENLAADESAATSRAFWTNQQYIRVLEANDKLTSQNAVPADEAAGVNDLNEIRLLVGLDPLLIDPKLHNAARDHSKDMATLHFFAHESPVPGKKTPWDRAKLAGTSASAENIASGDSSGKDANHGWFLSPGHHVNMLGAHRRVGMGRYDTFWTQLFGR